MAIAFKWVPISLYTLKTKYDDLYDHQVEASWLKVLRPEFDKEYMKQLKLFLVEEQKRHVVYPPNAEMFAVFEQKPF